MGLLALYLMAIIGPGLISVHGGRSHNAVVQKISGIEQFVPPKEGCVGWVTLDASKSCTWCREMFRQVLGALHKTYHSTESFISPTALVESHNPPQSFRRDMKGTCFINYLITDNYKGLSNIFNPVALKKIRTKDWIIFIEGEKTSHFLKCWANTIDANFGFVFPKVVLIMMHTMKTENNGYALSDPLGTALETINYNRDRAAFRAAVACYMCPEGRPYFVGIQQGEKNPYNLLKKAGERKGLGPPGISLEAEYFNAWRPTPPESLSPVFFRNVLLSVVEHHLNFTLIEGDPKSGIIAVTVVSKQEDTLDSPELKSAPVKRFFLWKAASSLVYCRAQYTNKYITALVSPFRGSSWVWFLVTVISICILSGVRFWGGLDLLWLMQGHPPQAKKIAALIILSSIIMYPIQILYKEYYASNAMTPYKMDFLDTNQKVFAAGFRYVCDNGNIPECVKHADRLLSGNNMEFDLEAAGQYFISPEEYGRTPNDVNSLAYGRDKAAKDYDRKYEDLVLQQHERYIPGTKCNMAEDYWWVRTVNLQFTGPLSKSMYDTLQILRQAGIFNFWHKVPIEAKRRKMKNKLAQQDPIDDDRAEDYESGIVYMEGTLKSIMVVYLCSCVLTMICFFAELMSARIVARWNRWRERRRYLRAIWPLGKI